MSTEPLKPSDAERRCSKCGALMAVHTLRGLCPNCLALFAFASRAADSLETGSVGQEALAATVRYIGDYELLEEIGRGGMGVVYRARQTSLNRTVAVKMIIAGEFAGPAERQRFQREAEAAAQLRHPNIVAIHEVGEHEGRCYFSMDFIEGNNLSVLLREEKLSPARIAALVKTLAEAVQFAHQRGILHRDLKPQNILVGADGQPHILDFGLARPVEREAGLTRTGDVMGSPSYMPPEQAAGRIADIGPATDVYALGAVLYEAITGTPPFTGESPVDVLSQVMDQDPAPPRKHSSNVPVDLETICLKCLEKRPERRYHSARALAEELERFLNFEPILARRASLLRKSWSWSQRNPWVFAAGLGLAALALICVAFGLWEQTQMLHWRLNTGKEAPLVSRDPFAMFNFLNPKDNGFYVPSQSLHIESPAVLFFFLFPAACLLLYVIGHSFRKSYQFQRQGGPGVSRRILVLHAAAGIMAAVAGMGYLLLQIRFWMWQSSLIPILVLEIAAVLCALALNWMGFRMVWETVGIHETSRYRGLVNQSLDRQLADEKRRWPRCLYLLGLAFIFLLSASDLAERKGVVIPAILCVLLSTGCTALATWAIRNRRRVFTFVCVPAVLAGFAILFMILMSVSDTAAGLLLLGVITAVQTVAMLLLFKAREPASPGAPPRFPVNPWLDAALGFVFAVGIFALVQVVENWRGKTAWEKCKSEFAAKGRNLDWKAYVPPPIPDDKNIFKAPHIQEWFTGRGANALSELVKNRSPLYSDALINGSSTVAIVTLAAPGQATPPGTTVLRYADPNARTEAARLVSGAIGPMATIPQAAAIVVRAVNQLHPVSIVLQNDRSLSAQELAAFFPSKIGAANAGIAGDVRIEPSGPIAYRISVRSIISAPDLVHWLDACKPEFDQVRQALQRPLSRMEGNYEAPLDIPIPSFVASRCLAQTLGAGAQSYLLLDDPQSALAQLTLMHDARHLLQGPPSGQPETLVAAMVNAAIAGLYVNMIQDGLRLHAWRDPQLAALDAQLKERDLLIYVDRAMEMEQVWLPAMLERIPRAKLMAEIFNPGARNDSCWKWEDLRWNLFFRFAPRGWLDQSAVISVESHQPGIDAFDLPHHAILPTEGDNWEQISDRLNSGFTPYNILAGIALPNFKRSLQITAHNQTSVSQARIACALERYRLAHREYPPSLDTLVPRYLDQIPRDTIGGQAPVYRRGADGEFELSSAGWAKKERWTWPP